MKIAIALYKILHGGFKATVDLIKQELSLKNKFLNARQLLWLIFNELQRSEGESGLNDITDVMKVKLKNNNLRTFQTDWKRCLLGCLDRPEERSLSPLYHTEIQKCLPFAQTLAVYNNIIEASENKPGLGKKGLCQVV